MTQSAITASVIVPTCNRTTELAATLASLRAQTHRPLEIVLINDGDLDLTAIIADADLEAVGITLQYVNDQTRTGPSAARNRGLRAATGDIIGYLDDDDVFTPEHLALHVAQYADPSVNVVYSDANRCVVTRDADGVTHETVSLDHSRDHDPDALLVANYIPILCLSHRRECLEKSGLFEESLTSLIDWDFFIRLSAHYHFHHLAVVTGTYYEQNYGTSVQEQNRNRFTDNLKKVYERTAPLLADDPERHDRVRQMRMTHMAKMLHATGMHYEAANEPSQALTFYTTAAKADPKPDYYLATARIQKALGLKKEMFISLHLAQYCNEADQ